MRFTTTDLAVLCRPANPAAVPRSLNPRERRVSRQLLMLIFAMAAALVTLALIFAMTD